MNQLRSMILTAIIEDDDDIREGVKSFLNIQPNFSCRLAVDSVEKFLDQIDPNFLPDVLILDITLPGMNGLQGSKLIKSKYPSIEIVMFTIHDDSNRIFEALCNGAIGYLLKNTPLPQMKLSIEQIFSGGSPMSPQIARKVIEYFNPKGEKEPDSILTEREKEIVAGLVDGLSYQLIGDRMQISIDTVRQHIRNIYKKLQVNSKAEVIAKSIRREI